MKAGQSADLGTGQSMVEAEGSGVVDPVAALDQEFILPSASSGAEASGSEEEAHVRRQGFRIGGLNLLCPRDASREIVRPPAVSRIPNTAPWLNGVANVRGALTPVVDMAEALDIDLDERKDPYLLIFGHGAKSIGLLIDGLPKAQTLGAEQRLTGVPPVPRMLEGCIIAAYDHENEVWLDLNLSQFFETLREKVST